jgi:hypothetical protein
MTKQSDKVKEWRKNTKRRIIESMGGKCVCCGYNKCDESLALHHLDPSEKELSFGAMRANPKNWKAIVVELRKCVLVCNNCHGEIHHASTKVPENAPRFNEQYLEYRKNYTIHEITFCVICGKEKEYHNITCSRECSSKRTGHIDWIKYDIAQMIKEMSIVKIAEIVGCSDSAVHKRLKKLNIPI